MHFGRKGPISVICHPVDLLVDRPALRAQAGWKDDQFFWNTCGPHVTGISSPVGNLGNGSGLARALLNHVERLDSGRHKMVDEWTAIGADLENWMSRLPAEICRNVPFIHLAIPGSHVSASYSVSPGSAVSPDCQALVSAAGALLRPLLFNWAVTQSASVAEQLRGGVRYLDLRVASCPGSKQLRAVHGLYGGDLADILTEASVFLNSHAREVLVLDFQRFHGFSAEHHARLRDLLARIFGARLCPRPPNLFDLSLLSMRERGLQAIVLYRDAGAGPGAGGLFWPDDCWPVFRPAADQAPAVLRELELDIASRPSGARGRTSVCAITPEPSFMRSNALSTLRDTCVTPCHDLLIPWLHIHRPGHAGFNVLVADFVDSFPFCRTVVQLNKKLLW